MQAYTQICKKTSDPDGRDRHAASCGNRLVTDINEAILSSGASSVLPDGYGNCTGTSMSAPFVSATAGLMMSANPLLQPDTLLLNLMANSDTVYSVNGVSKNIAFFDVAHKVLNMDRAVASSFETTVNNRLTPLFHLYSQLGVDRIYTSWPQQASAAIIGTLPPVKNAYTSRGANIAAYNYFPKTLCETLITGCPKAAVAETPKADFLVYTTHNRIATSLPLVPLYRLSTTNQSSATPKHQYTTTWPNISYANYQVDGVEGYIIARTATASAVPATAVKVCRKANSNNVDTSHVLLFPVAKTATCTTTQVVDGITYNVDQEGINFIGYAFAPFNENDNDFDGIPDSVEPSVSRNKFVKDNDIFTAATANNRLFVMQQYRDFLTREGDTAGVNAYTTSITGVPAKISLVESFMTSGEFDTRVAPMARLYFAYFSVTRIPDYEGLLFWAQQYIQGRSLNSISQSFAGSQEFDNTYGSLSNRAFIERIYLNVLERPGEPSGIDFWTLELDRGTPRGNVMALFSESNEFKASIRNRVLVNGTYFSMLRRSPDQGGFDAYLGALNQGQSLQTVIGAFYGSQEYRDRFL